MKLKKYCLLVLLCPLICVCQTIAIPGKIINEQGEPIASATVTIKRSNQSAVSDKNGLFTFPGVFINDVFIVSAIGYETIEAPNNGTGNFTIILKRKITELDEAIVIGYGSTTRRLNTGSVVKVTAEQIEKQPVANPLLVLQGQVPGLIVSQTNGVPGAAVQVRLRGQSSLGHGSDPLYIIDGVPFAPNNNAVNQLFSAAAPFASDGLSPFSTINPADIESIEVLKDADATAIYGSRGANGVILISTKKGKTGKAKLSLQLYSGISTITRSLQMLNTPQYLQMRREAFANDGITPDLFNAPDLLAWDTSRYTDFSKLIIGGKAHTTDLQATWSGGNDFTQFLIAGGYRHETTIFPGSMADNKGNLRFNLNHISPNKKFTANFSAGFTSDKNNLIGTSMLYALSLPPNAPPLYGTNGKLNWQEGGVSFSNPLSELERTYTASSTNLLSNLFLNYKVLPGLMLKTSLGYNNMQVKEESISPRSAFNPLNTYDPVSSVAFGNNAFKSWIAEPQAEYKISTGKAKFTALLGGTWQHTENETSLISASGFVNDALIRNPAAASYITAARSFNEYNYMALFGRVTINWRDKYILNASGRRDGSSRFGPGRQFSNFGGIGMAWIFSEESVIRKKLSFLSYGKVRASYGNTGNDQIGNYGYLDTWIPIDPYQGAPALIAVRLFNPDYSWEINRKLETALDLGFLKDRLLLSVAYFRNRSGNQLINYPLPGQTGFSLIVQNFPAVIENRGFEFTLASTLIEKKIKWSLSFNGTIHRNKLSAFPGIASSSYANLYVVGKSLSLIKNYRFLGVDPATGVYQFDDVNKDGVFTSKDYTINGDRDPRFYGGITNTLQWKSWRLDLFLEYRKQSGANYLLTSNSIPGMMGNQPVAVLDRWQHPGDTKPVQQFTASASSDAYAATDLLNSSNAIYSDASFLRFKNLSLAYIMPPKWLKPLHLEQGRIFFHGQNIATWSGYKGADPENQNSNTLPPLKTFAAGIQITF